MSVAVGKYDRNMGNWLPVIFEVWWPGFSRLFSHLNWSLMNKLKYRSSYATRPHIIERYEYLASLR